MPEHPIGLLVPAELPGREPPPPARLPALPDDLVTSNVESDRLHVGVAALNHSGRVRDLGLISALGWRAGDMTDVRVTPTAIVVRRRPDGAHRIDERQQVFIPASARSMLQIGPCERVALVALPDADALLIHPLPVVAGLLAEHYARQPEILDEDH